MTKLVRNFTSSSVKGDLYKYQNELPKLPVPTLQETTDKYIKSVEPFLSADQLATTKKNVSAFLNKEGPQLQDKLVSFAKTQDNWLAAWWDDYAYLAYRDPIVPYVSYFFAHKDVNNSLGKDQLYKATLLSYYAIEFAKQVEQETIAPEIIKGNPYCMNAFKYMFNNCRVPAENKDITKVYPMDTNQYFVVVYKNAYYKVNFGSKGEIYRQLQSIVVNGQYEPTPVGVLTSLNRDSFAKTYNHMTATSPVNAASFESIFASAFVVCLDDVSAISVEEKSSLFWHGNGQNRYFDKPLEFLVAKNGSSGFLGEHSKMDATPTVQLNNYILDKINQEDQDTFESEVLANSSNPAPQQLKFDFDAATRLDIALAIVQFDTLMATYDTSIFHFHGYGKNLIKQFKVSPDAYVQMLMQLSYYKLTGKTRPTYESAATRKFLKGRTETGRSASNQAKAFVETWTNPKSSIEEKVATFQDACKQHVAYLSAAAEGKGVDRHLFGLKQMLAPGEPVPAIFTDPIFNYSQTWFLSTSQVPLENFVSWGFSQVIDEGLGLAYLVNKDWLNVHISAKEGQGLSSAHLKWYLTESAAEMKDILSKGLLQPKAKL